MPALRSQPAYLQVEYVSSTGQGLPSIWQAPLAISEGVPALIEWLGIGVGVMGWQDVSFLLGLQ